MSRPVIALFYALAAVLGAVVIAASVITAGNAEALAGHRTAEAHTEYLWERTLEWMSLGYYEGGSELRAEQARLKAVVEQHEAVADAAGVALAGLAALFIAGLWRARRRGSMARLGVVVHLLGVSGVFLAVGLLAPVLTITAYKDLEMIGPVVLSYESKGILTGLVDLLGSGNYFLAGILFLFSVCMPVTKLALTGLSIRQPEGARAGAARRTVAAVGKWSMTDVFVVALLVALFAAKTQDGTDAWVGHGMYFFALYGLLSLAAGQMAVEPDPPGD